MTWSNFLVEARGWQTVIGSVFGFGALLAGALWNFRLNRKRDAQLRREETVSIAAALYGEVIYLRRQVAMLARGVARRYQTGGYGRRTDDPFDRHFVEMFRLPEPAIYPALASKIGMLPPDVLLGIASFYADYQEAKAAFPLLVPDPSRGFSYGVLTVLRPSMDAVTNIAPTLRQIESLAQFAASADPDTGIARGIIDMEEEELEEIRQMQAS